MAVKLDYIFGASRKRLRNVSVDTQEIIRIYANVNVITFVCVCELRQCTCFLKRICYEKTVWRMRGIEIWLEYVLITDKANEFEIQVVRHDYGRHTVGDKREKWREKRWTRRDEENARKIVSTWRFVKRKGLWPPWGATCKDYAHRSRSGTESGTR